MKHNQGTTLVEMLVAMLIAMIMLFAVTSISEIGKSSHKKLYTESGIYNDIAFGFKLIQNRIHETADVEPDPTTFPAWVKLRTGSEAFGIYANGVTKNFIYLRPACDPNNPTDPDECETILSVPDTDALVLTAIPVGNTYGITLSGTKDGIPFNMQTTVKSRLL